MWCGEQPGPRLPLHRLGHRPSALRPPKLCIKARQRETFTSRVCVEAKTSGPFSFWGDAEQRGD